MGYEMEELIPIVAELAERYTGYESTSVTYEKANQLMEAVIYCIHEYETAVMEKTGECGASAEDRSVTEIASAEREMYHELIGNFHSYGYIALKDAVAAVPEFLKWYDIKYDPQNTILTLDYPVLEDLGEYSGIDAVYEYVRCICIEQRFLGRFPEDYVRRVLRAYSEDYEEMFENLCGIVLADAVQHILLKKPLDGSDVAESDRCRIQALLGMYSGEEAKEAVREIMRNFVREFYDDDGEMQRYMEKECGNIAVRAGIIGRQEV